MTVQAVGIHAIGVVVPARNEESRLPRCLAALSASARVLRAADIGGPRIRILVVVDRSVDGTMRTAQRWPGVEVVQSSAGRVGAARGAGIRRLLDTEAEMRTPPRNVWIACTDADSSVPPDWLAAQLRHARAGVELLLGTVSPDPDELAAGVLAAWRLRHIISDGHPHVHGANLGIRGDIYQAAGGFPDVVTDEDVLLRAAVLRDGGRVRSVGSNPVLTSGRTAGRAPSGLADYLRALSEDEIPLEA